MPSKQIVDFGVFSHSVLVLSSCSYSQLTKAEKDLEEARKMNVETLELTWDKALAAALSFQTKGKLGIYRCLACGNAIAVKVVSQRNQLLSCPSCGATSPSFSRLKLVEQDKA